MVMSSSTIIPLALIMVIARYKPAAIESILPVNVICRAIFGYVCILTLSTSKGNCFPATIMKVTSAVMQSLSIAEFFLFRMHYALLYICFILVPVLMYIATSRTN